MNIEYCGYSHNFTKNPLDIEPDIVFKERCWFIAYFYKNWIDKEKDYDKLTKISKLWANIKFNNCFYSEKIMKDIHELTKNTIYEI